MSFCNVSAREDELARAELERESVEEELAAEDVASKLDELVASDDDSANELELTMLLEVSLAELTGVGLKAEANGRSQYKKAY